MLPNFIVIGAPKCGTTSLCDLLSQHPEVFMSKPKEIHFFGRNDPKKTPQWYKNFFSNVRSEIAVGEGSTSYTHPEIITAAATEIAQNIPHCRLIYMVRNPIKRLESDWRMRKHEGWADGSINHAVSVQQSLITHGLYWQNLSVYREHFAEEQILVLFLEDFIADPSRELKKCCNHIGVDPDFSFEEKDRPRNASGNLRRDGKISSFLRKHNLSHQAKSNLPPWLIDIAKRVLTRKQDLHFKWEEDIKVSVQEKFQEDSASLLNHYNKPPDFWG